MDEWSGCGCRRDGANSQDWVDRTVRRHRCGTWLPVLQQLVTPPPRVERSIVLSVSVCVCLSAIISSELHVRSSPSFLRMLPMALARSSSGGVMIRYVAYFRFYA